MKNLFVHVAMVVVSAVAAYFLVTCFEIWYDDCEARRRAKWERKQGRYE